MLNNPLFVGNNPIPFEIIIKEENNESLFEQEVIKKLETPIEKNGYKFKDAHIKLGSKIHLKDFYYAEKLFQNSYYAIRFAYLLSQYLLQNLEKPSKEITVLGYGLYSELLVSNTARFLNKMFGIDKFNHCIVEDVEDLSILNLSNLKPEVLLIIPIGSTLTTQIKIYRKLRRLEKGQGGYQYESSPNMVLNPICVVVVGHKKIEEICSNEGEITESVVKKFWGKVDTTKKEISLANIPPEFKDKNIEKTHYFLYLPSEWHLPHECKYCWSEKEQKPLFYTDKVSVSPKTIFELPRAKEKEEPSFELAFEVKGVKTEKANIMPDMVKYGHYKRGMDHYLFYIDTNLFFAKNKKAIKNWLDSVKENLKKEIPEFEHTPCLLIAPSHETNIDFVNLVNEEIFSDTAHIIYYDPFSEDRQNLRMFLERTFGTHPLIFFVDDALCTGRTFYYVKIFLKSLGQDFTASFVMLNRLSYQRNLALQSKKIYAFCQLEAYLKRIKYRDKKTKIYAFCQLEAPVVVAVRDLCYLCREKKRYQEILNYTLVDALRKGIRDKIKKLELKDIRKQNSDNIANSETAKIKNRHFTRLELTHRLYHKFSQIGNSDFEIEDIINDILKKIGKKINQKEIHINLIKTLSQPPFIYHRKIRQKVYPFILKELDEILTKVTNRLEDIQYAIILIKRLAYLGCPELLKSKSLEKIKKIFDRMEIKKENLVIYQEWIRLRNKIQSCPGEIKNQKHASQPLLLPSQKEQDVIDVIKEVENICKRFDIEMPERKGLNDLEEEIRKRVENKITKELDKIREKTMKFNLIYALAVKEVLVSNEAKAFRLEWDLDELLRTHQTENTDFYDFLKLLYIENNIIIKNAINLLTEKFYKKIRISEDTSFESVKEKIKRIPFEKEVKETIKMDYRLSYLRYLINYKIKKQENSDILDDNFYKEDFYQNILVPLLSLSLFLKVIKQDRIAPPFSISDLINYILKYLLKIAHISEENGGVFLGIKKGFSPSEEVSELYIIGKLGKNSESLNGHLTDQNSWTIKVFNGVKTSEEGNFWTNVERYQGDDEFRYYGTPIRFEDLYEYKKLQSKYFLFLRIADKKLEPKGILVFYKETPFSPEEQRNLLLLRDNLCDFLVKHYENYSFEEWVFEHNLSETWREIAHDLKTPLTRLRETILNQEKPNKEKENIINKIIKDIDDILSLINLGIKRGQTGVTKIWLFSFFKKLEDIHGRNIQFEIIVPENVYIMGDTQYLKRVFNNIIQNAKEAKATKVKIELKNKQLLIQNNGQELSPDIRGKIFEKEFSTKANGSGLGLYIAQKILSFYNAKIELIETKPVTFSICFKELYHENN